MINRIGKHLAVFVLKRDRNTQVQKKSCKGKLNEKTNSYTGLKKIHTTDIILVSLACVNDETRNLQLIFRPGGVVPYIGYIGMCSAKGYVFLSCSGLK